MSLACSSAGTSAWSYTAARPCWPAQRTARARRAPRGASTAARRGRDGTLALRGLPFGGVSSAAMATTSLPLACCVQALSGCEWMLMADPRAQACSLPVECHMLACRSSGMLQSTWAALMWASAGFWESWIWLSEFSDLLRSCPGACTQRCSQILVQICPAERSAQLKGTRTLTLTRPS